MVEDAEDRQNLSSSQAKSMGNFQDMMKPENLGATMRQFMGMGMDSMPMIEQFMDKINIQADGGHLLQAAIHTKAVGMVKVLIQKGTDLQNPPIKVPPLSADPESSEKYRQAPFIIQAACAGDLEIFKILEKAGCSLSEVGYIHLTTRRHNHVASNVIGAAAFHGHAIIIDYVMKKCDVGMIDVKAIETVDRVCGKSPFKAEMNGYTPLQLCVVSPKQNAFTIKVLFARDANHEAKESSTGNNILHLAAQSSKDNDVLEYVVKNAKLNIFARNNAGDTPLTICQQIGNTRGIAIIEECQAVLDDSAAKTDEFLAELMNEDDKNERARQRKKEKKHRSKLQKLAEKNNCTIEDLERVFKEQEEQKKLDEKAAEKAAVEAEKQAELAVQRERMERIAEIERQRAEELAIVQQIEREEKQQEAAEKAKKRLDTQLKYQAQMKTQVSQEETAAPTTSRKQQKQKEFQDRKRQKEEEKAAAAEEATPEQNENETAPVVQATPTAVSSIIDRTPKITGLTGDLAVQKMGKNMRKKFLEEQKQQEEEKQALKERIQNANKDRAAQRIQKEKDERRDAKQADKKRIEDAKAAEEAAKEAEVEAEKELARQAKLAKKKEKEKEKKALKKQQKKEAVTAAGQGEVEANGEQETPVAPVAEEKEFSARRSKKAEQPASQEPAETPENDEEKEARKAAAKAERKEKDKKKKAEKAAAKAAEKAGASEVPVYQAKKSAAEEQEPSQATQKQEKPAESTPKVAKEEKKKPKKEATEQSTPKGSDSDLAAIMAEMKDLRSALQKSDKARKQAEKAADHASKEVQGLNAKMTDLQEQVTEQEQESGTQTSVSEREMQKQIKKLTNSLQQQVTVNKTLSSKLMIQEKAFIDEKRARLDLDKRLSAALASRPPSGPQSDSQADTVDGLSQMQYNLARVNQQMQHSLQQR